MCLKLMKEAGLFIETSDVSVRGLPCAGGSPVGPEGPCAGAQVPGSDSGLLHHLLLLRGTQPGLHCQWQ